jgi:hypothetical protein
LTLRAGVLFRLFPRLMRVLAFLNRWFPPLTGGRTFSCLAKKK